MAEKRFKADKYYFEIWDNDEFLLSFDQTVNLLNQLNDENNKINKVMKKYGISSVEELDHILFYARVW